MSAAQLDLRALYADMLRRTSGGSLEKNKAFHKLEGMLQNFEEVLIMIKIKCKN